jgi:hypothetical protein
MGNHTVELDIIGTATSVENLDADLTLGQASSIEPYNS